MTNSDCIMNWWYIIILLLEKRSKYIFHKKTLCISERMEIILALWIVFQFWTLAQALWPFLCGTYDHQNKRNFRTNVHFKITQHNSQCDNIQTKNNVHSLGTVLLTLHFYFHLLNYLCLQFFACLLSCR